MIKYSNEKNLLLESNWKPFLQDVDKPNLFRDLFEYDSVPKVAFNFRQTPTPRSATDSSRRLRSPSSRSSNCTSCSTSWAAPRA